MFRSSLTLCAGLLLSTFASAQCRVTRPTDPPFVPPAAYAFENPNPSYFAYGSEGLWTELQVDGRWVAFGKEGDGWVYQNKLTFWHRGFDWRKEMEPKLIVTGKRLDGDAPTVTVDHANAVFIPNREAAGMMMLFAVPTVGCWGITARYEGNDLSFVVSVEPKPAPMSTEQLELYGVFLDSITGTNGELGHSSLALHTVPLVLDQDTDGCAQGIGFKISREPNPGTHDFPASITHGRSVYLVDPIGVGATDREAGVLSLSEIGFDDDHRFAVLKWEFTQAGASGLFYMKGGTLVYRKIDGKWSRSNQNCLFWIT